MLDWKEVATTKKVEKLLHELHKKYESNQSLELIFADALKLYKYIENVEEFTDLYSLGIKI